MLKIKVDKSKKGSIYRALVYVAPNNKEVFLTFDLMTILRVYGRSLDELYELPCGYYEV